MSDWKEFAADVLDSYRVPIGLGLLGLAAAWALTPWKPNVPAVPQVAVAAGGTAILAGLAGRAVAPTIVEMLMDDSPGHVLVSLGMTEDEEFSEYALNDPAMDDLDVLGGDLYQYPNATNDVRECVWYDPEENVAMATWRGALSDREQARDRAKIEENRTRLEEEAMKGVAVDVNKGPIVRRALRRYVRQLNRTVEDMTLPDANVLENLMDEVTEGIETGSEESRDALDEDEAGEQSPVQVNVSGIDPTGAGDTEAVTDGGETDG